jgi:hypothetical protein
MDNLATGMGIGIAIGAAIGAAWPEKPDDSDEDGAPPSNGADRST